MMEIMDDMYKAEPCEIQSDILSDHAEELAEIQMQNEILESAQEQYLEDYEEIRMSYGYVEAAKNYGSDYYPDD